MIPQHIYFIITQTVLLSEGNTPSSAALVCSYKVARNVTLTAQRAVFQPTSHIPDVGDTEAEYIAY
jgi:hypothetical protein